MNNAIKVQALDKHFGPLHAVNSITFSLGRGEVLGFLGPNGAGKSTTMKMIAGFLAPSGGSVKVLGFDVVDQPLKVKAAIGYLPEGAPSYGEMTPRSFLDFIADIRGLKGKHRKTRMDDVIAKIHLDTVLDQRIETLSKGYKRRVGLAQAILHDPEVLILDEPTDGLDPNQKHEVRTLIRDMAKHKAIIISTHILEEVDAVCTRATIIADGRLLFDGSPDELARRSPSYNAVSITLDRKLSAEARQRIAQLPKVRAVSEADTDGGDTRLIVQARDGQAILGEVSELVRTAGWPVREMQVEAGRLDDVFRRITTQTQQPSRH
jgi:ABC-2 type transport system ATP-binding protein